MQNVLSGTISVIQCSSSIGTVWKSSSSECSGVLSGSWSLSELSGVNDRWQCTGHGEVHGELQCGVVAGQQGVVCAGSKDACSMLEMWCVHGVFAKVLVSQLCWNHSRNLHPLKTTAG